MDGTGLALLDRWTYALCPVDVRDGGIDRLLRWGVEHASGGTVPPPTAGHLPAPDRADQTALERAEKIAKRLVAWRWLSQHFPDVYADTEGALAERRRLDVFIETVLRQQAIGRRRRFETGQRRGNFRRNRPAPSPVGGRGRG
jgi:ATP-dependent RNA helicase SUPV3L1/SUV3